MLLPYLFLVLEMEKIPYLFKLLLIAFVAAFSLSPANAQKELKQLKAYIKSNKSADALKEVTRLMQDSVLRQEPQVYAYAFSAHKYTYEQQNEKMYLGQAVDSVAYFTAVRGMYDMARQCEKYEALLLQEKGRKIKFRSQHSAILQDMTPNLLAAARFSYSHAQYGEAEEAVYLLLNLNDNADFWAGKAPKLTPLQRQITSMIHVQGNYKLGLYERMYSYSDEALKYQPARAELLEELAVGRLMLGDSVAYCDSLTHALEEFPERASLYERLAQFYMQQRQYTQLLYLAQSTIDRTADSHTISPEMQLMLLEHKAYCLYTLQRFDELEATALQLVAQNPDHKQGNFYLGIIYCRQAELVNVPLKRTNPKLYASRTAERKSWYEKALGPMEKFRELSPSDTAIWAPRLYNIYLTLNMGKEFEDISKVLP